MTELPLAYRLPLEGLSLIEASAGTGKTHALVRLIARHVLWHGRPIDQVLAVTFTKAATAELRSRLRDYLQALNQYSIEQNRDDADFDQMLFSRPPELALAEVLLRLQQALANIDKASIYTIHGFCQRVLNEQPILTGQSIPGPDYSDQSQDLILQICHEFWRQKGQEPLFSEALSETWTSPDAMLNMTADLLSHAKLMPERPDVRNAPDFDAALARLRSAFLAHYTEAKHVLQQAIAGKALNGTTHKIEKTMWQFTALEDFVSCPDLSALPELSQLSANKFKLNKDKTAPINPLFNAIDDWLHFVECLSVHRSKINLCLVHDFRAYLHVRLAELKTQRNLISSDDFIEHVLTALQGGSGAQLAQAVRDRFPVALVDEFQDTDDRQWAIFKTIYAGHCRSSLTLIGDPKQAIYAFRGGDIHTYLNARESAQHRETLLGNYRTDADLLASVHALFTDKHPHPFYEPGIDFIDVTAEKSPGKVYLGGDKLPALQFFSIPAQANGEPQSKTGACLLGAQQCANQIAWLTRAIHTETAHVISDGATRALSHHDIVVLVATHKQASLMQRQLSAVSVPSVCVDKASVFDSYEALDIQNILSFLLNPCAHRPQQNARHGVLMQCLMHGFFDVPIQLERLAKQGVLGCFSPLLQQAERAILALQNGERRLSNYWQIVELTHQHCPQSIDLPELLDWYSRQLDQSSSITDENDSSAPRLESGAQRVRIMTLHQSKGLEFGIVFMPFTAIGKKNKATLQRYFDGTQRCLHYARAPADPALAEKIQLEQDSENLRLLYVGATRAVFGLYLSWGHVKDNERCALHRVLHGGQDARTEADVLEAINRFAIAPWKELDNAAPAAALAENRPSFLKNTRRFSDSWKISSFSGLHQARESLYRFPAHDESPNYAERDSSPYKGAAFGNALHYALEHADVKDWHVPSINALNASAKQLARLALVQFGYDTKASDSGIAALCALVINTLHGRLPEGVSLIQLEYRDIRHEMEFHLRLKHANSSAILHLLHQYGYCQKRSQFGFSPHLHGLLTGKIDLIFTYQQRYYIVDYKSNLLSDYSVASLMESIVSQEYDLQYILYCVALHRFLTQKLGASYDYQAHFGGVRYLYARGMQPGSDAGIFSDLPPKPLIEQLDQCFDSSLGDANVA